MTPRAVIVALTLVASSLTGCSAIDSVIAPLDLRSDVDLTPAEARADLAERQDQLEEIIGGSWYNQDNFLASSCGDGQGFYYYGARSIEEAFAERATIADSIAAFWKGDGYEVRRAKWGQEYVLSGKAENGTSISVHLGADRTWMSTDGPCIRGDWQAVQDDDFAHHRNDFPRTPTPIPTPTPTG